MTDTSNITNTVLTTLDIGSGIDSRQLAQDLTDAVKIPQENSIQKKIDGSEASISAYGLVKLAVKSLQASFEKLNDANELSTSTGASSDSTKLGVSSVTGSAPAGSYDFTVSQLAQNQRMISDQYTSTTQSLNSGSAFDVSLSVGQTKSAVAAIYNATATASETTTLVVGDGTTTVSIASATYSSIADQVTAIQGGSGYSSLLFTVDVNSGGDGIAFTYKSAGAVASTPTFTGTGSTHTITNPTVGVSVATAVTGVAAEYSVTGTASETTTLVVSDGTTTISVDSATYANIAAQVSAIQASSGYDSLKFSVSSNDAGNGFKLTYKTTGLVSSTPTFTGSASSHTVNSTITGVTPVNAATTTTLQVQTDTPDGVVKAINDANTGVTATLLDTGTSSSTYRIMLSGQSGGDGIFTITSTPDLGFHDTANLLQSAQDSVIQYDGLTLNRSSNQLDDVLEGVTLNLLDTSSSAVTVSISNDKSTLKASISDMIVAYNDVTTLFDTFADPEGVDELSGSLSGDISMVGFIKEKIRAAVFGSSSTPSNDITALRHLGVTMNEFGDVKFDETTYDAAVATSYDDIVTMLTADTTNENLYTTTSKGLAQDVATILEGFTESTGIITSRETSTTKELSGHQDELVKLEKRMDVVYARYLQQFGAMETLMATLGSTKDYLTSQFETLKKAYDD